MTNLEGPRVTSSSSGQTRQGKKQRKYERSTTPEPERTPTPAYSRRATHLLRPQYIRRTLPAPTAYLTAYFRLPPATAT